MTTKEAFKYDVILNPYVSRWLRQLAERDPQLFIRLTGDNVARIKRVLGHPDETIKNEEIKECIWKIQRDNVVMWVSAGNMGTSFKAYYSSTENDFIKDKDLGSKIVVILTDFAQSLTYSRIKFYTK